MATKRLKVVNIENEKMRIIRKAFLIVLDYTGISG